MMLATGALRVVLVTTHLPLRDVPSMVDPTHRAHRSHHHNCTGLV
jgi:4-hydroxy-L-threonine phosphate dehydrogenase PdxA